MIASEEQTIGNIKNFPISATRCEKYAIFFIYVLAFAYSILLIVVCSIIMHNKYLEFENNTYNTALIIMILLSGCFSLIETMISLLFRKNEERSKNSASIESTLALAILIMVLVKINYLWSSTYGLIIVILTAILPLSVISLLLLVVVIYGFTSCCCG